MVNEKTDNNKLKIHQNDLKLFARDFLVYFCDEENPSEQRLKEAMTYLNKLSPIERSSLQEQIYFGRVTM